MKTFVQLLLFLLFLCISPSLSVADTITISGSITLPDQVLPISEDSSLQISIYKNWNGWNFASNEDCGWVTIAANTDSIQYSCSTVDDSEVVAVKVNIWNTDGVYRENWHNSEGTTFRSDKATLLPGNQNSTTVDFILINTVSFSGQLYLPGDVPLQEDKDIFIKWHYFTEGWSWWYPVSTRFTLIAGETSLQYVLQVPEQAGTTMIGYSWQGNPPAEYLSEGYYNTAGAVFSQNEATQISAASLSPPYDITLLKGISLTGTIGMPNGETDTSDCNLNIHVSEEEAGTIGNVSITIPAGESSTSFTITLPPDMQAYLYYYGITGADNLYMPEAYYSTSGTVQDRDAASIFSTSSPPGDIVMTLIPAIEVSGTVSFPEGVVVDVYTELAVRAYSVDESTGGSTSIGWHGWWGIAAQQSSSTWSMKLPAEPVVDYYIVIDIDRDQTDPGPEFLGHTFYSSTNDLNTADQSKYATKLNSSSAPGSIDTTLLTGNIISGTITKQSGDVYNQGDDVFIRASWPDQTSWDWSGVAYWVDSHPFANVAIGADSITYQLAVPPSVQTYSISYGFNSWQDPDIHLSQQKGFYNSSGTVYCQSDATVFQSGNYQNKDISILPSDQIMGTVSLPSGILALEVMPINIGYVYDPPDNSDELTILSFPEIVEIGAGENSVDYQIGVQRQCDGPGGNTYVGYNQPHLEYATTGFYNSSGTASSIPSAEPLTANQSHSEIDMLLIMTVLANDINNDGQINLKDAILGLQVITGQLTTELATRNADSDMDGKIGLGEVISIMADQAPAAD